MLNIKRRNVKSGLNSRIFLLEHHPDGGAHPFLALDFQRGVQKGRAVLDDGQAQAGAAGGTAPGGIRAEEAVEDVLQVLLLDADFNKFGVEISFKIWYTNKK